MMLEFSPQTVDPQISNFMKILPEGAESFHEDGQTYMTKLIVAFNNFVNAPKSKVYKMNNLKGEEKVF
jgi:hypothetical protein